MVGVGGPIGDRRIGPGAGQHRAANSGRTSPIARVIVDRDTPNQQASTSWVTP
jgi:hypothetical protein